jgi:DUF971 family protein
MADTQGAATPIDIELIVQVDGCALPGPTVQSDYDWEVPALALSVRVLLGRRRVPGRAQGQDVDDVRRLEMIDIELVGRYAMRPTWRDNHGTGIFTFRALRGFAEQDGFLKQA